MSLKDALSAWSHLQEVFCTGRIIFEIDGADEKLNDVAGFNLYGPETVPTYGVGSRVSGGREISECLTDDISTTHCNQVMWYCTG